MDGRRLKTVTPFALAALLLVAGGAACGGRGAAGARMPAGARILARGSLAYAAVPAGDAIVTIELEERFALVVRDPDSGAARARHDLGPAERDLVALAADGTTAWVGGRDQRVRAIALDGGAVQADWPIGADVTALRRLDGGWLAIGDATGAVCLRRVADGALVQCAVLGRGPVTGLVAAPGAGLTVEHGAARATWTVPALASTRTPAAARRWRGVDLTIDDREVRAGTDVLVRFAGRVRMVEVGPRGDLIIAAWIAALDDPSVVRLTP